MVWYTVAGESLQIAQEFEKKYPFIKVEVVRSTVFPLLNRMLNEARADMMTSPHVALFPSLAIFLTVLAFNLLGDGLRDALDPKLERQ